MTTLYARPIEASGEGSHVRRQVYSRAFARYIRSLSPPAGITIGEDGLARAEGGPDIGQMVAMADWLDGQATARDAIEAAMLELEVLRTDDDSDVRAALGRVSAADFDGLIFAVTRPASTDGSAVPTPNGSPSKRPSRAKVIRQNGSSISV